MLSNIILKESEAPCTTCLYSDICKYREDVENYLFSYKNLAAAATVPPKVIRIDINCKYYRESVAFRSRS